MSRLKFFIRTGLIATVLTGAVGFYMRDLTPRKIASQPSISAPNINGSGPGGVVEIDIDTTIEGPYIGELVYPASFDGSVVDLPYEKPEAEITMPELEKFMPGEAGERVGFSQEIADPAMQTDYGPIANIPVPGKNFIGLDQQNWGAGYPPDTHGDVGTTHYIQAVNNSVGIFSKATGARLAAFTFDTLISGTNTPCDANNHGDPVVIYDHVADRWILSDFAWTNTDNGPYYECFAVSKTNDPVNGGWWFYGYRADDATHPWLADYPKFGNWPDALYMSTNMFDCANNCDTSTYKGAGVYALNKSDMYSGAALRSVRFFTTASYFSLLPSHWRTASPAAGTPNYFVANSQSAWALEVWKFAVNWTTPANSTFTGPTQVAISSYTAPPATVPSSANALETLHDRLMTWNHYSKVGNTESLWLAHTAGSAAPNTAGIRWYQLNVTGGTIATTPVQQSTYKPNSTHRFIPSLAVDKDGNMAVVYSASASGTHPSIRYAGRLASDPLNALSQGETTLIAGGGSQSGNCGPSACTRWGDYASMSVDPTDSCTFWFTTEYYAASGMNWQTRIGSFKYPSCGSTLNVLANPGFDTGSPSPWVQSSSSGQALVTTVRPRTGSHSADFCGNNSCTDYLEQTVTVPTNGTLTYYWYQTSTEGTTTAYDYLRVRVYSTSGTLLATPRTWSNRNTRNVWSLDTISLAAYAGQTVKIRFIATTDGSATSQFFVDDTSLR